MAALASSAPSADTGAVGFFRRKQGRLKTMSGLAEVSEPARAAGFDLLEATEEVFVGIRAPSRLGTAVVSLVLLGLNVDEDDDEFAVYLGTALFGYASRMAQTEPPQPPGQVTSVDHYLLRSGDGQIDYERMSESADHLGGLLDYVTAPTVDRFTELLGASDEVWQAFAEVATMQLHRNLARNGVSDHLLPDRDLTQVLLEVGYHVRFIDEIAGEEPLPASALN